MASLKPRESSQQPEAESGTTEGGKAEEHAQRQQRVANLEDGLARVAEASEDVGADLPAPEHADRRAWLGDDFDPDKFEVDAADADVAIRFGRK